MNDENLIPFDKRAENEQREIARKGGIANGEMRRQRKTVKEALRALMDEKAPNSTGDTRMDEFIRKAYENELKEPNLQSLLNLQKLLGELVDRMEINTDQAQSAKEALDVLLGRKEDNAGA